MNAIKAKIEPVLERWKEEDEEVLDRGFLGGVLLFIRGLESGLIGKNEYGAWVRHLVELERNLGWQVGPLNIPFSDAASDFFHDAMKVSGYQE